MYPQSDGSLAMASDEYISMHQKCLLICGYTFLIETEHIHQDGYGRKVLFLDFDLIQTCLIFPLRWACFPIKISPNAQWEHLFLMYFDDFSTIYLIF